MPSFANPFQGNVARTLTKQELIQAVRLDIASELEAIFLYDAHAAASDDPLVVKVLKDIRDEEVAHIGELMTLWRYLDPSYEDHLNSGVGEVKEMMQELGISEQVLDNGATVGSLLNK